MKRKIAEEAAAAPAKKRSPLLGRPQKHYEAPSSMSKAELSEWRKQQRKERNRASAAASRMKTQTRIMELEGEVGVWKAKYEDMQDKMMKLQRQVDLLTKVHYNPTDQDNTAEHSMVSPTSSHLDSPSSSHEQVDALSLLQSLSRPQEVPSSLFPSQSPSLQGQATVENEVLSNVEESKKHLNKISRQA